MKRKLMDIETDWEIIKEHQLNFLAENAQDLSDGNKEGSGERQRAAGGIPPGSTEDRRDAVLRALVFMAINN